MNARLRGQGVEHGLRARCSRSTCGKARGSVMGLTDSSAGRRRGSRHGGVGGGAELPDAAPELGDVVLLLAPPPHPARVRTADHG